MATINGVGHARARRRLQRQRPVRRSSAQRLALDEGDDFAGKVSGLGEGDSLNFTSIGLGRLRASPTPRISGLGGLLTASDGIDSISIQLFGDYAAGDFVGLQDQDHGFVVTYHPFAVI